MGFSTQGVAYTAAVAATAVAACLRAASDRWLGLEPVFLAPVAVAGWLGGLRCGLFATALAALAAVHLTESAHAAGVARPGDAMRVGVFVAVGVGVALLSHQPHRYRRRAEAHARAALARQAALEEEVAERRRAEQSLLASREELSGSERRLRLLLESLPQLVWTCTVDGRCDYLSRQWVEYTGVPEADQLGDGWAAAVHPNDRPRLLARWRQAVRDRTAYDTEYRLRAASGEYRWFVVRSTFIASANGSGKWFGTCTDVHDAREAAVRLQEGAAALEARVAERTREIEGQRRLLDAVLDALPAAVIIADPTGRVTRMNRACERVWGTAPMAAGFEEYGEWVGYWPESGRRIGPHEWAMSRALLKGEACPGELIEFERFGDRSRRSIWHTGAPVYGARGEVVAGVVASVDVTAQVAAERASRDNERRFRAVVEACPSGLLVADAGGRIVLANAVLSRMFGWAEGELVGQPVERLVPAAARGRHEADRRGYFAAPLTRSMSGGREVRGVRKDGTEFPVEVGLNPVDLPGGVCVLASVLDITARKQNEALVREREGFVRAVLDALPAHIAVVDRTGAITAVNRAWEQFAGENPAADGVAARCGVGVNYLAACDVSAARGCADAAVAAAAMRAVLAHGGSWTGLEYDCHAPRERRWFSMSVTPLAGVAGGAVVSHTNITSRKLAEETVRASEEQFRSAFDNAPIGMALVAPDGRWLRVNRSLCAILGYAEAELLATDFQAITHPDDLGADLGLVRRVLAGAQPTYQMEKRYLHKRGHVVHALLAVSLVRDAGGGPLYFISQIKDITQRKRDAQELAAHEALLRQFITHSPAAIAMFDRDVRYLQVSNRWATDYRLDGADLVGRSHYDVFPDLPDRWKAVHRRVLAGAVEACAEDPFERADGSTEWLQWECRPWHTADGGVGGLVMFTQVVTARKRAELAVRASEERFRVLFEQSSDAHLIFTEGEGIIDCNPAAVAMLRCPDRAALLRLHPAELSPEFQPDGRRSLEKCVEMDATARRNGHHRFDWLHRRVDGDVFPCEVTLTPVTVGGVSALLVVWHDLTERARAEAALRASEERYRAVVESLAEGVVVQDAGGSIVASNRRASDILGLTPDQIAGRTSVDPRWRAVRGDGTPFPGHEHPAMVVLRTGRPVFDVEMGVHRPAGDLTWMIVNAVPMGLAPDGGAAAVVCSFHDVTEGRRLADRVRASLWEKEVLLKEIHHRVKNNLQIVSALLELQAGHADPAVAEMFSESQGRVLSMAMIHERLYKSADLARVDFTEYVAQLAADLYRTYKVSDDDVRLDLDVSVPPLPIDVAIPCGLLLNELVSNCLKHAFRGAARGRIRVAFGRDPDGANVLEVSDDGAGLPEGFDLYNTPSFGMQLITTLVDQLDGEIVVVSASGTSFRLRFPKKRLPSELATVGPGL